MSLPFWDYFLSIEGDLEKCSRFIHFSEDNYKTYSIEFARIIMASSSEFDTVIKLICNSIDAFQQPDNILKYYPILSTKYPKFKEFEVNVTRYKLTLFPWKEWSVEQAPDWWSKGYNKIKHQRDQYFKEANLINALSSVSGLLCGILYYFKEVIGEPLMVQFYQAPKLFNTDGYSIYANGNVMWSLKTPD
jgi:hypothetical protein